MRIITVSLDTLRPRVDMTFTKYVRCPDDAIEFSATSSKKIGWASASLTDSFGAVHTIGLDLTETTLAGSIAVVNLPGGPAKLKVLVADTVGNTTEVPADISIYRDEIGYVVHVIKRSAYRVRVGRYRV